MAPVAMIDPWPRISRGAEPVVPKVPGLVRVMEVPRKASGSMLPFRAFSTRLSKTATKRLKSRESAPLMLGTTREWVPSRRVTSTAMPRLMTFFRIRTGRPSRRANASFIPGCFSRARTTAQATRWVKDIFGDGDFLSRAVGPRNDWRRGARGRRRRCPGLVLQCREDPAPAFVHRIRGLPVLGEPFEGIARIGPEGINQGIHGRIAHDHSWVQAHSARTGKPMRT